MENRGGKRIGSGRKKGGKNPVTLEKERVLAAVKQRIMQCADELFEVQMELARQGNNVAIESLLNRAFGKPMQSVDVTSTGESFWDGFMRNKKEEPPLANEQNNRG